MLPNNQPMYQGDKVTLQEFNRNRQDYVRHLRSLATAYRSLDIGYFTEAVLVRMFNTGTEQIFAEYKIEVDKEIEAAGIKSKRLQEILTKGYYEMLGELSSALNELIQAVMQKRQGAVSNPLTRI